MARTKKELTDIREEILPDLLKKNLFNENSQADITNPLFVSPLGKETIGNTIDQNTRKEILRLNEYNEGHKYTGPTKLP